MNILTAKKFETKIKSVITVSNIYSIGDISQTTNIDERDVTELIEKMIRKGNSNNLDFRQFKNAHIDYKKREIVLDKSKSYGLTDIISKMTYSFVEKLTPNIPIEKKEWECSFCKGVNAPESNTCEYCGAQKK